MGFVHAAHAPQEMEKEAPMSKVPEKWHDAVMEFSLDIAKDNENFPKKVLSLFDKHFGCRRSIFFTHGMSPFVGVSPRRVGAMNNYIRSL